VKKRLKIALVGNPNSGKSSLFNALTGLHQKVGNFPGVTVDKKTGILPLGNHTTAELIDLPGTYSLYPRSEDERVTFNVLMDAENPAHPDLVVIVADATNLRRHLLFITQIIDLGLPALLVLNKIDMAEKRGIEQNTADLARLLGVPVVATNARSSAGIDQLKTTMAEMGARVSIPFYQPNDEVKPVLEAISEISGEKPGYRSFIYLCNHDHLDKLLPAQHAKIDQFIGEYQINIQQLQARETVERYQQIAGLLTQIERKAKQPEDHRSEKIDKILLHPVWGYGIFLGILFVMFQAIFAWASWPMDWIESLFNSLGTLVSGLLPDNLLADLLVNGVIPGLGGVVVFVPQIVLLFFFLALLEETGYMARVSFLMDQLMRKFGLNGKSIVPLIGGYACAVPSIMATRTINSWKERILTIMVLPLMSCSARLPVYTLLIGLSVPDDRVLGLFNLQGLILMAFYLLGFFAAIGVALIMKWFIRERSSSFFLLEMPAYQLPRWGNIGLTLIDRAKTFVFGAGKVILAVSMLLWALSSYGPGDRFEQLQATYETQLAGGADPLELENQLERDKLAASYAGSLGKFIEPAIAPLGFDWKIGISIITSFAAREVFVGTMATIYSLGAADFEETTLRQKMMSDVNPRTGQPVYTLATTFSLLVFYAFAMQCMSTLAITYRETRSWKWPALQFVYMTGLAYLGSLLIYTLLK